MLNYFEIWHRPKGIRQTLSREVALQTLGTEIPKSTDGHSHRSYYPGRPSLYITMLASHPSPIIRMGFRHHHWQLALGCVVPVYCAISTPTRVPTAGPKEVPKGWQGKTAGLSTARGKLEHTQVTQDLWTIKTNYESLNS